MDPKILLEILITALTTLLENCPEPEPQKLAWLRKPKLIHELRFAVELRKQGLTAKERREARAMADELQKDATDADLKELIASGALPQD